MYYYLPHWCHTGATLLPHYFTVLVLYTLTIIIHITGPARGRNRFWPAVVGWQGTMKTEAEWSWRNNVPMKEGRQEARYSPHTLAHTFSRVDVYYHGSTKGSLVPRLEYCCGISEESYRGTVHNTTRNTSANITAEQYTIQHVTCLPTSKKQLQRNVGTREHEHENTNTRVGTTASTKH